MQWRRSGKVMRPLFPRPEKRPERPSERCANIYQDIPIDIAKSKYCYSKFPFFKCIVTIPFRIIIQIWNKYQTHNNKSWKHNTSKPWIKINHGALAGFSACPGFDNSLSGASTTYE